MTFPNHIIGGIAVTGTIAAFGDTNILSDWRFLAVCFFASALPDIDAPKSIIGKIFKPISSYINTHYGHRTITHSLVVLFCIWFASGAIEVYTGFDGFCIVFTSAYFSHILLDMVTLQGVAFLYPWMKNPCVLPGRPENRIRTGDVRSETIFAGVFIFAIFTLQPLFERGFWNSYNRSFGTLKHLHSEFRKTPNALWTTYEIQKGSETIWGSGTVVFSSEFDAWLFNDGDFIHLESEPFPVSVSPDRTDTPIHFADSVFINFSLEQIQELLDSCEIIKLEFQSTNSVTISANKQTQVTNKFSGEFLSNVSIIEPRQIFTDKPFFRENPRIGKIQKKIKRLRADFRTEQSNRSGAIQEAKDLRNRAKLESNFAKRQTLTEKADEAEKAIKDVADISETVAELEAEMRVLESEDNAKFNEDLREWKSDNSTATLLFTGYCELVRIGAK